MRLTPRDRLVLLAPASVLLLGWLVLPALLGLAATFTSYTPFGAPIRFSGLRNYGEVVSDPVFQVAVRNIAIFTAVAVPLELAIGFGVAYLLRRPVRGRSVWRVLLLVPWLVSPIANGVMWHFLLGTTRGLLNFAAGWAGLPEPASPIADLRLALAATIAVEVWRMAPLVAFLLLPGLAAIPAERWEDARLNGAPWLRRVLDVALPSVRPLLLAVAMLLVGLSLGTFDTVLILTGGGPGTATVTPALYSYAQAFQINDWPAGTAAGWLIAGGVLLAGLAYISLSSRDAGAAR